MSDLILVIGKSGQLATELSRISSPAGFRLKNAGHDELDLSNAESTERAIASLKPAIVINAAAYTAVDKAETDAASAFALNRDGPAALARACARLKASLVHVSTDYVFDGEKASPYVETDAKAPTSVYGRSKSEGEDAILASDVNAAVVRTSWVYAAHGSNFLRTMLRLAETRDEINVVADQLGRPTWARDLAHASLEVALALRQGNPAARGIFHYSGAGDAVWADFAQAIFEGAAKRGARGARVKRISSAEFPTPTRRPANSRLDAGKIESSLGIKTRDWREACALCLDELLAV